MTAPPFKSRSSVAVMRTERVTLDLDTTALHLARYTAKSEGLTLAEWISKTARARALEIAAEAMAEHFRLHPEDDDPEWTEHTHNRIFEEEL